MISLICIGNGLPEQNWHHWLYCRMTHWSIWPFLTLIYLNLHAIYYEYCYFQFSGGSSIMLLQSKLIWKYIHTYVYICICIYICMYNRGTYWFQCSIAITIQVVKFEYIYENIYKIIWCVSISQQTIYLFVCNLAD